MYFNAINQRQLLLKIRYYVLHSTKILLSLYQKAGKYGIDQLGTVQIKD